MKDRVKITEQITVGAQPTQQQLEQFAQEGFRTVINLRTAGEEEQPLSPQEEGAKARDFGMHYLHIPVSMQEEHVEQFRRELPQLPTPIFIHCRSGKRSGAFTMMHLAVQQGLSGEETLQKAEKMGFECNTPALKEFVRNYVDKHTQP